jgi:hypothetical protein
MRARNYATWANPRSEVVFFGENDLRIRCGVIEDELIAPHLVRTQAPRE